ncbi:class I SAM-dependent methyltransferase [Candidatus Pelagibacter sp.]|nr:class I SAM-dependent methyltransferase [Candidatus Pelagibacter sp.]
MGSFQKKAESEKFLQKRLQLNKQTQKKNFQSFLFKKLKLSNNLTILDLGCGHGQTSKLILKTKKYEKLFSVDINNKFIKNLKNLKKNCKNFYPIKKNMDSIKFDKSSFDLIIMSYCFYYSKNYKNLILKLFSLLKKSGRVVIANPYKPHFMVNFISKVHSLHNTVYKSLNCSDFIYSFCKKKRIKVKKSFFKNHTMLKKSDILNSYLNSTMYNPKKLKLVKRKIDMLRKPSYNFFKNTCIIEITRI